MRNIKIMFVYFYCLVSSFYQIMKNCISALPPSLCPCAQVSLCDSYPVVIPAMGVAPYTIAIAIPSVTQCVLYAERNSVISY